MFQASSTMMPADVEGPSSISSSDILILSPSIALSSKFDSQSLHSSRCVVYFLVVGQVTESGLDDPSHLAIFAGEREDSLFSNDSQVIVSVYFTTILPIFPDLCLSFC
jgi:hypothetical protein